MRVDGCAEEAACGEDVREGAWRGAQCGEAWEGGRLLLLPAAAVMAVAGLLCLLLLLLSCAQMGWDGTAVGG